jgi:hypothetical protein
MAGLTVRFGRDWRHERAVVAAKDRHTPHDPDILAHRERLRAARAAYDIARIVESAPPLTAEQRNVLALCLLGGGSA